MAHKREEKQTNRYNSNARSQRNSRSVGRNRVEDRRYTRRRVLSPSNLLAALVGFLFVFCLSVVLTLNLRQIYYLDIKLQNLESDTGLTEETIRENYDTLIDYNLLTKRVAKLEFPDFTMSEQGRTHFAEVKRIFVAIQIICVISGILFIVMLFKKFRRRDFGCLKLTSILTLAIPVVLGVMMALNWNVFFVKFHQIFFKNNYWIFNPATDPVINILPDAFFLHCAVAILLFMLAGCILCGFLYRLLTARQRY